LRSIGPLNVAQKGNCRKAAMPWSRPITGTHLYFPYEQKLGPIPVPSYSEIWLFSCTMALPVPWCLPRRLRYISEP
jgi:hypothetical protein